MFVWVIFFAIILFFFAFIGYRLICFYRSAYAKQTGNSFFSTWGNKGAKGEYLLGLELEKFDPSGKMLFNAYIPRPDGTTSEIDAILVSKSGVYVFENKNYSGWIYGKIEDKVWTETFHRNAKYHFLNPIQQNYGHIEALRVFLDMPLEAFVPVVVFGDNAEFKNIRAADAILTKTSQVASCLKSLEATSRVQLTDAAIETAYRLLYPCTQVSDEVKTAHVNRIKANRRYYARKKAKL